MILAPYESTSAPAESSLYMICTEVNLLCHSAAPAYICYVYPAIKSIASLLQDYHISEI